MQAAIWTPGLKKAVKGMKRMEIQNNVSRFNDTFSVISVDEQKALTNVFKSNQDKKQTQPKAGHWM